MIKITLIVRVAVALMVCIVSLPREQLAAQEGSIQGVVMVGEAPVNDANVVIPGLGRRVRVDGAGRFSFERVPVGRYAIEAESVRWGRGVETVTVVAGQTVQSTINVEAIFHLDEVVVSAGAVRRSEGYQPASVVTSRDLVARGEVSLGETLSREPGVSSTYFGPGASRPVIRGIGGDRVRILENGIGIGDASSTSPDHAVGIEARSAERIEVIRGPATLLYGSSAVGGIVNVLDGKIAREPPTEAVTGYVEGLAGSVSDERTGSAGITLNRGPVVVTASGLWRDASDYSIPGFADVDATPSDAGKGALENSALQTRRGSGGVTVIGDRGYLGASVSLQRSDYGVPGDEMITIDLDQNRLALEGALRFSSGAFRNLKGRFGFADYEHTELEGSEIGTQFFNNFFEGRLESEHSFGERSQGTMGAQFSTRDFEAVGDEAFVPPTETRSAALFAYETLSATDRINIQGGLRYERQVAESRTTGTSRSDNAVSASFGVNIDAADALTLSASLSRSVKLPNAEELFSNGPHAATLAFEIGNPDLVPETALGIDLTAHVHTPRLRGTASFFSTGFSDYIHEAATGAQQDGLDEFAFVQADARFIGLELEGELDIVEGDPNANSPHVSLEVMGDFVRATLSESDEYLPRIPSLRIGGGVNVRQGPFVLRGSARRTTDQNNIGPFETATRGFTMVDASISYRIFSGSLFHDITLAATNLTDEEARLHTSFLKDRAPLPGREIRLVYRLNF